MFAGVELGGTKCLCILGDGPDAVHEQVALLTGTPGETLAAIAATLDRWRFDALGIASFGPLDLATGRIVNTPKPGWSGVDLSPLTAGLPAIIDTDVNGAALAEGLWGGAQGLQSWTYITVGTGIGVGSIVDGVPIRGLGHSEAGHQRVARIEGDDFPGACPYHGDCVEGLANGPAIAARVGHPATELSADDPAWRTVAHALAGLCHNLVLTTLPQRILIGGGIGMGRPHLLPMIRGMLARSLAGYGQTQAVIDGIDDYLVPPTLEDMAGPLGALALARAAVS